MIFEVINVQGDGHCMYRCIWRLAKYDRTVAAALSVSRCRHRRDEDEGTIEVRRFVGHALRNNLVGAVDILGNMIELHGSPGADMETDYPVLRNVFLEDTLENNCMRVATIIETSNVMASSFELDIIKRRLSDTAVDIDIIVLSYEKNMSTGHIQHKWLLDLQKSLDKTTCHRVTMIVNEDNIHYRYVLIDGKLIVSTSSLKKEIDDLLKDEDEDEGGDS